MKDLNQLVTEYIAVRKKRMQLEKEAAELKQEQEEPLKDAILMEMSSIGVKSVKFEGIGTVCCKASSYYEISDIETLTKFMLEQIVKCANEGRPLSDGLLLQGRVKRDNLEEYIGDYVSLETAENAELSRFGVRRVDKPVLSITKN